MFAPNLNLWKCNLTWFLSKGRGRCGEAGSVGALTKERLLAKNACRLAQKAKKKNIPQRNKKKKQAKRKGKTVTQGTRKKSVSNNFPYSVP